MSSLRVRLPVGAAQRLKVVMFCFTPDRLQGMRCRSKSCLSIELSLEQSDE